MKPILLVFLLAACAQAGTVTVNASTYAHDLFGSPGNLIIGSAFCTVSTPTGCTGSGSSPHGPSDAYVAIGVSGSSSASIGHITLDASMTVSYFNGAGVGFLENTFLQEQGGANYEFLVPFNGLLPSAIRLTFTDMIMESLSNGSYMQVAYQLEFGSQSAHFLSSPSGFTPTTDIETFSVDPIVGSATFDVFASVRSALMYSRSDPGLFHSDSKLSLIELLDANGNVIGTGTAAAVPEPASLLLWALGLLVLVWKRRSRYLHSSE